MLLRHARGWDLQLRTQISKDAKALCNICLSKNPHHDLQACYYIRDRSHLLLDLALFVTC